MNPSSPGVEPSVNALLQQAIALHAQGQWDAAIALYAQILARQPRHFDATQLTAAAHQQARRPEQALQWFGQALAIDDRVAAVHSNYAALLHGSGQHALALQSAERALALDPRFTDGHMNRAVILTSLDRRAEALAAYEQLLAIDPAHQPALLNAGNLLLQLRQPAQALQRFTELARLAPDRADAHERAALAAINLGQHEAALAWFDQALALDPGHALALNNRANLLMTLRRLSQAAAAFEHVAEIHPSTHGALGLAAYCRLYSADWQGLDALRARIAQQLRQGQSSATPFSLLPLCGQPDLLLTSARLHTARMQPRWPAPLMAADAAGVAAANASGRIRLAYLSHDFNEHAVMRVMAEVFELHDRARFEVWAYNYGAVAQTGLGVRLRRAFEHIVDCADWPDAQIAQHIQAQGIHVLVDLMGHTGAARLGIVAHRPAPVIVNHIGFPGSMGTPVHDAIIGDAHLIPAGHEAFYSEQVLRLPDCYLPLDRQRPEPPATTRAQQGLPPHGLVLCAFSNTYKINPEMFALWMALLRALPGSVLWLLDDNPQASANLRREASTCGLDPARLVFAPRAAYAQYLARYRLADLFLDTLPYNALATAADALWMGLPVVTCSGQTYVGRGAGSILLAAGLPELIAPDLAGYQALVLQLATDAAALARLRQRVQAARAGCALFDTPRYVRHLEQAYQDLLAARAQTGQKVTPKPTPKPTQKPIQKTAPEPPAPPSPSTGQWLARALSLHNGGQHEAALALYQQILAHDPRHFDATHLSATLHAQNRRFAQAELLFARALALNPGHAVARGNYGMLLRDMGRAEAAIGQYQQAARLAPQNANAHFSLGALCNERNRWAEALAAFDQTLALAPAHAKAHVGRARALIGLKQFDTALQAADQAIAHDGQLAYAHYLRGVICQQLQQTDAAQASYERALALNPNDAHLLFALGNLLGQARRYAQALPWLEKAAALDGSIPFLWGVLAMCALATANHALLPHIQAEMTARLRVGQCAANPFFALPVLDDAALLRRCAELVAPPPVVPPLVAPGAFALPGRIRLAYLTHDLRDHAVSRVLAAVLEQHDRRRFELHAIHYGPVVHDAMRARLAAAFDQVHDLGHLSDQAIARHIHALGATLAIDLMGHTSNGRPDILAWRPAPVAVNLIGYPGSIGATWIDYIIGDALLMAPADQAHYSERLVRLPGCYLPHDPVRSQNLPRLTRAQEGLPEDAFVLCAFSNPYKISPEVFAVWLRLLHRLPQAVLWLVSDGEVAQANLTKQATQAGVAGHRLVFAPRTGYAHYLARYALADLFIDTAPYNALATANDALWLGLPVITRTGQTYVGRGATSMLHALGLPELACADWAGYEAAIVGYASDPGWRQRIGQRLHAARSGPPFDVAAYTHGLQAAYAHMAERAAQGLPPQAFDVQRP